MFDPGTDDYEDELRDMLEQIINSPWFEDRRAYFESILLELNSHGRISFYFQDKVKEAFDEMGDKDYMDHMMNKND